LPTNAILLLAGLIAKRLMLPTPAADIVGDLFTATCPQCSCVQRKTLTQYEHGNFIMKEEQQQYRQVF